MTNNPSTYRCLFAFSLQIALVLIPCCIYLCARDFLKLPKEPTLHKKSPTNASATKAEEASLNLQSCATTEIQNTITASQIHELDLNKWKCRMKEAYGIEVISASSQFDPKYSGQLIAKEFRAQPLDDSENRYMAIILERALAKYPPDLVRANLKYVINCKLLTCSGIELMGTYSPKKLSVIISRTRLKCYDNELAHESTFHHEFSSLLMLRYPFVVPMWNDSNAGSFKYTHAKDGSWNYIKNNPASTLSLLQCYELGYLSEYGMTTYEEDFNAYSEFIMADPSYMRWLMKDYPLVRRKVMVWREIYKEICPTMSLPISELDCAVVRRQTKGVQ